MVRNITPFNDTPPTSEIIPDRSNLAQLYERPKQGDKSEMHPNMNATKSAYINELSFQDTVIINLLIVVPYILSFLSIAAIYSLGPVTDPSSALQSRINMALLTIPALFPWLFTLRILRNKLANYHVRLVGLLSIYLLFILPILNITIKLRERDIPDFVTLVSTFILSQIFIWLVAYALKSNALFSPRIIAPSALLLALIIYAIFL